MMTGYWISQAIYVAAKLGLADLLANGPMSSNDLAQATQSHPSSLHRLLRALASVGIFAEASPNHYTLTPLAAHLRSTTPDSLHALAIMYAEEQYHAWSDLLFSIRSGQPAFDQQFGMGVFPYLAQNPAASQVFQKAMTGWTNQVAGAVVGAYDFSPFRTVVDVGGSQGILLAAILQSNPAARGILFDLPHVIAEGGEFLSSSGIMDRCTPIGGDFFTSVPSGGDAYILAQILHDWDDDHCVAILKQCRRVIPDQGKLLIVELVLPSEGNDPFIGKWLDLHMLVLLGGRERTALEYGKLFQAAGFTLGNVVPTNAGPSVVEAIPD